MDIAEEIKNDNKYYNKSKATSTPFPSGITGYDRSPEIIHTVFMDNA
jgi:hypothetical protein